MIVSFGDKKTEQIFNGIKLKRIDSKLQLKMLRRLRYIDAAEQLEDLRIPPSNRLEKKEGDLRAFYGIRVNRQWRVIFKWIENAAHEVQIVDYH